MEDKLNCIKNGWNKTSVKYKAIESKISLESKFPRVACIVEVNDYFHSVNKDISEFPKLYLWKVTHLFTSIRCYL